MTQHPDVPPPSPDAGEVHPLERTVAHSTGAPATRGEAGETPALRQPSGEDRLRHALRRVRVFPVPSSRRVLILEIIEHRCSLEDLRNLTFYLGLEYDAVPGDRKMAKARALITHYERRDDLDFLVSQLLRIRPDLEDEL